MGFSVLPTRFVGYLNTIHGVTQVADDLYFLHSLVSQAAKMIDYPRAVTFLAKWGFPCVVVINGVSCFHRTYKFFSTERFTAAHEPRGPTLQEGLDFAQKAGLQLFFLFQHYLPVPHCSTFSDLSLGLPYLLNGLYNIQGEETFNDKRIQELENLIVEVHHLEVCAEYSEDLQRLQKDVGDGSKRLQFLEELRGLRKIISSPEQLTEEINQLEVLRRTLFESSLNGQRETLGKLRAQKEALEPKRNSGSEEDQERVREQLVRIDMEIEEMVFAQNSDPKACTDKIAVLEVEIQREGTAIDLKRDRREPVPKAETTALEEKKLKLKRLKFVNNSQALNQRITYLKRMVKYPRKLDAKLEVLGEAINLIDNPLRTASEIQAVTILREAHRKNAMLFSEDFFLQQLEVGKIRLPKNIAEVFHRLFFIKNTEDINTKLIDCSQLVVRLKEATRPVGGLSGVMGGGIDQDKKIALYSAIDLEIQAMNELIEKSAPLIKATKHKDLIVSLERDMKDYFRGVQYLRGQENSAEREKLFEKTIADYKTAESGLQEARQAFLQEQAEFLDMLIAEKTLLENRSEWSLRWERFSGPLFKIAFGGAIVGIRVLKLFDKITPNSQVDVISGVVLLSYLVKNISSRIFFRIGVEFSYERVFVKIV